MISVRGRGVEPTTAARAGLGVRGFMKAALGVRFFAGAAGAAVAFFAVAMLLVPSMEWILYQRKTVAIHWQADANGKKTLFQAYPSNFCLDLLLWRCFLRSFCILARFRGPHWQVGRRRQRLQRGLAPLAEGCCARRFLRSEEHTSELQSPCNLVCRLLLEKKT